MMKYLTLITLYVSLMFTTLVRADIEIQPGLSGAWVANASGQGVFVNIARTNDQPNFVLTWYAYLNGNQVWLIGSQSFDYGLQQLTIPMSIPSGADWGDNFVENDVQRTEWGSVTVNFTDCNNGTLQYDSNNVAFGANTIPLIRLTTTDGLSCDENIETPDKNTLDESEKESLVFMREEEKMARDVYLLFFRNYGVNVFTNISLSEQTHMDAVLSLMNTYNVSDSSTGVEGTFNNQELQELYNALVDMGSPSLADAYLASALIEETDIRDIEAFKSDITSGDILQTYDNLLCGSRNHLRSFVSRYESETGNQYTVQLPELANEVAEILSSSNEQCGK